MRKNQAGQAIGGQLLAADGSAVTSGTTAVFVTGDAGTQAAGGGAAPVHEGNGFWTYAPTQAETNYDHVAFTFTNAGAVNTTTQVYTRSSVDQTGDSYAIVSNPSFANLQSGADQLYPFTVGASPTTTSIPTGITGAPHTNADHFAKRVVTINQATRKILASSGSPVVLTVEAFPAAPAQNDPAVIS